VDFENNLATSFPSSNLGTHLLEKLLLLVTGSRSFLYNGVPKPELGNKNKGISRGKE